jgi:hypothetical protein
MADEVTGSPTPPPAAPAPAGTPPGTPTPKPRGKQLAILLIGGPLLAFGGCALFLSTMNFNSGAAGAGGIFFGLLFAVGTGMFLVGCMIALAVVVQRIFYSNKS